MTASAPAPATTAVAPARHRCVQWATGNIGARSLRGIIEHPHLDLVGVYVTTPAKRGIDAGDLCGLPPIGLTATDSVDDVIALAPDCVLYMPAALDVDDVVRLLTAGIDVVTTRGEFHRPASMDVDLRGRIERACAVGGTSIHSTGSSPGFITEAVPLVLSSLQRRIDQISIDEFADLSQRDSPDLLFGIMGFGGAERAFEDYRLEHLRGSFGPSLELLAESIGIPLDSVEVQGEVGLTTREVSIAAGSLAAGTVGAQRITVSGITAGRELVRFRANWYCTTDTEPSWDLLATGWRVVVDGDAPLSVDINMPIDPSRMAETTPGYTANRAVNAVRHVCAATPGIRTSFDLPQIVADLA
ncbi:NAD(P)H-dependent amine dehydrogenase family protein [Gordonia insulae]|uniref:2,4-diaminopentanoate dehydrogenase n=1 Tax=Gordonia insulae TaxID=2420509 RepID=A0A3G8JL37_9ACTN|nr:dihydrodipicolinate reductase [Gordonia insulae]AZG45797.1 2,4-diaminopentanoate dehydrogenase [Gordonia insulae]